MTQRGGAWKGLRGNSRPGGKRILYTPLKRRLTYALNSSLLGLTLGTTKYYLLIDYMIATHL